MNIRQRKRLLSLSAVAMGCAACATVVLGLVLPMHVEAEVDAPPAAADPRLGTGDANAASKSPATETTRPSRSTLKQLCSMDLHRPLYDPLPPPEPKPQKTEAPPSSPLKARLVGIAIEHERSMALFQMPDGSIEVCGAGESFEQDGRPVKVTHIAMNAVNIEYANKTHQLQMPTKPERR